MSQRFAGKKAVVTGGANGIGRASSLKFAEGGAAVAILDIEEGPLQEVAKEIRAAGVVALPLVTDLSNRASIAESFQKIGRELGDVDILLNNVGQTARERATEFWCSEPEIWDFVIGISLMATIACSRQVIPMMRERKAGKIVNIASDSAIIGDRGMADYCAAKAGVMGFTRAIARELAPFKVNVNAVCPGATRTRGPMRLPKEALERALAGIPMGEMCEPEDIANGVAFLASEEARFVTGQALVINGGRVFY